MCMPYISNVVRCLLQLNLQGAIESGFTNNRVFGSNHNKGTIVLSVWSLHDQNLQEKGTFSDNTSPWRHPCLPYLRKASRQVILQLMPLIVRSLAYNIYVYVCVYDVKKARQRALCVCVREREKVCVCMCERKVIFMRIHL